MADRIFGIIALAIALGYSFIAFTVVKAPFQYDPLGPETWPQILSVAAALCCLYLILRPDTNRFRVLQPTIVRIAVVVILLAGYAYAFEPLGFIISTALFCAILSKMLGATNLQMILFGGITGIAGYGICVGLLDLNLPAGAVIKILEGMS